MKQKLLLIASLSVGVCVQAQFTNTNAPAIGNHVELFGLDTLAPAYGGMTGSGVTWDYSGTLGIANETRSLDILDGPTEDTDGDFPTSVIAQKLEGLLTTFYTEDASGRVSQGIIFNDPSFGNIVAQFDTDPEQLYTFPFDIGSILDDDFVGHYSGSIPLVPLPLSGDVTGKIHATVDGKGTLKLADNDYSNVLRYKLVDTIIVENAPIVGDIKMIRVQYEYYDHAGPSNLPIFIHTNVVLVPAAGGAPLSDQTMVLSIEEPSVFVGLTTNVLAETSVYPNPTNGVLNIQLPSSVQSADINITDALGRSVLNTNMKSAMKTLDISSLNKGMYFVNISDGTQSYTKRVVIR